MRSSFFPLLSTSLGIALLSGSVPAQGARWTHQAPATAPWIPTSVSLAGHENLVFASGNHGTPQLMLLATDGTSGEPLAVDTGVEQAFPVLQVAAGERAGALYAIAQYPVASDLERRTEVTGYQLPSSSGELLVRFRHDMGLQTNGPGILSCDKQGRTVVAAAWAASAGEIRVDVLDGLDGALLVRREFPASSLDALVISGDGTRIAVRGGGMLHVFDRAGNSWLDAPLGSFSRALDLSFDGSLLAVGAADGVRVFRAGMSSYVLEANIAGGASELPVILAIAANGSSYAVGWWHSVSGRAARFDWRDGTDHTSLANLRQEVPAAQNLPAGIDVSEDGQRAAFGTWGALAANDPRVFLFERGASGPVATFALPGSVQALDFDTGGTRIVVAYKDAHANQVASTGAVRMLDLGLRDLSLDGPVRLGGRLEASFTPAAEGAVLFVLGSELPEPPLAGEGLAVDRSRRMFIFPGRLELDGSSQLSVRIPDSRELLGKNFTLQAVVRAQSNSYSRPIEVLILD